MESFDTIVIGSGFGGSTVAYRLSDAGKKVCVLERGKAYPPGSFPRDPVGVKKNFWDPSDNLHGLFHVHLSKKLAVLQAAGLGGGSLIYSSVMLRKDAGTFIDSQGKPWPIGLKELEKHYQRVEKMIAPEVYPHNHPAYERVQKAKLMQKAADKLGWEYSPATLATTFEGAEGHAVGAQLGRIEEGLHQGHYRSTCNLCGECNFGCNHGSKKSLDFNYLAEATRKGATIRTLAEVREIIPVKNGYTVRYIDHSAMGPKTKATVTVELHAKRVVLAAGSLNSTYLLLRNRKNLPLLGHCLGESFNGNGDLLAFTFGSNTVSAPTCGPVITSSLKVRDGSNHGLRIQDTAYPEFINWMVQGGKSHQWIYRFSTLFMRRFISNIIKTSKTNFSSDISQFFGPQEKSKDILPICSMGRDLSYGKLFLTRSGKLELRVEDDERKKYYQALSKSIRALAKTWNARSIDLLDLVPGRIGTVHPIGGCPMGHDITTGVVNKRGEVFNYPGLYVADGSILPGNVGVNPALTIAAMADHIADGLLGEAL